MYRYLSSHPTRAIRIRIVARLLTIPLFQLLFKFLLQLLSLASIGLDLFTKDFVVKIDKGNGRECDKSDGGE